MSTNGLPEISVIKAPPGWEYQQAAAITFSVWGAARSALVEPDEAVRFVERVRSLRKRSTVRLFGLETSDDDVTAYLAVRHASSGYMLTAEFIRAAAVGDEVVFEKAERSIQLSDQQMLEILADLEFAGGVAQAPPANLAA